MLTYGDRVNKKVCLLKSATDTADDRELLKMDIARANLYKLRKR
jgi:hypothetical protein